VPASKLALYNIVHTCGGDSNKNFFKTSPSVCFRWHAQCRVNNNTYIIHIPTLSVSLPKRGGPVSYSLLPVTVLFCIDRCDTMCLGIKILVGWRITIRLLSKVGQKRTCISKFVLTSSHFVSIPNKARYHCFPRGGSPSVVDSSQIAAAHQLILRYCPFIAEATSVLIRNATLLKPRCLLAPLAPPQANKSLGEKTPMSVVSNSSRKR